MAEQNFTTAANFVVPATVTSVTIECWGWGQSGGYSGYGDYAKADYVVTPGEVLKVKAGNWGSGSTTYKSGQVRRSGDALADRMIVAGANGSGPYCEASWSWMSYASTPPSWEDEGPTDAGQGFSGTAPGPASGGSGGSGGTGAESNVAGNSQVNGVGGAGGSAVQTGTYAGRPMSASATGGHGGDGYVGGGGGGAQASALSPSFIWARASWGSKGSSYTGSGTNAVINGGARNGSAIVKITWNPITNVAPNAPLLVSPADAAIVATTDDIVFDWNFSDPDPGNSQSRWELEVRAQGSGTNTVDLDSDSPPGSGYAAGIVGTQTAITVPAGTFIADDWEWRVRTYDQAPLVGAWSGWRPLSVIVPPTAPVITSPANLETITIGSHNVTWTVTSQNAYEVRRLLDSDSSLLWHSGTIVNSSVRSYLVTFPTNEQTEDVQVRVRVNGIWSSWASVEITTDFLPPMTPTLVVTPLPSQGAMQIDVTHPTPTGGAPDVSATRLWVRQVDTTSDDWVRPTDDVGILIAVGVGPTVLDHFAASGTTYEYRVHASAASGVSSYSDWTPGTLDLEALFVNDPDTPSSYITMWLGEEAEEFDTAAEVRIYGGGRRRVITRRGASRTAEFEIGRMTRALYYSLRDWTGQVVLIRTPRGKKIWGVIAAVSAPEIRDRNYVACSFSITETTHIEEVT